MKGMVAITALILSTRLLSGDHHHLQPLIEQRLTLDGGIAAVLALPRDTEGPAAAVLMLHGFASHKDEVGDLFKRLAPRLAEHGIASLRIDFPGWGESAGEMWESSMTTRVAATETAYAYLRDHAKINNARIGILGFSMGGTTARISAANHPLRYKSMVAWSSASNRSGWMLSPEILNDVERDGMVTRDLGWRTVTLGKQFFIDLEENSGLDLDRIEKYPGPYLAIAGSKDSAGIDIVEYVTRAGGPLREGVIIGCDGHIFEVLTEDQSKAERVLSKTLEWFRNTL